MIRRPLLVAAAYVASALLLVGALAWITSMALALERSEVEAVQRATHEENVRIALWRMDATLAELMARENRRTVAHHRVAAEPAKDRAAAGDEPWVRARFEIGPTFRHHPGPGREAPLWLAGLTLPPQPPRNERSGPRPPSPPQVAHRIEPPLPILAKPPSEPAKVSAAEALPAEDQSLEVDRLNVAANEAGQQMAFSQEVLNTQAFRRRQELALQNTILAIPPKEAPDADGGQAEAPGGTGPTPEPPAAAEAGGGETGETSDTGPSSERVGDAEGPGQEGAALAPRARPISRPTPPLPAEVESAFQGEWRGEDLVLLRQVLDGDERRLQGIWLDWPALSVALLAQVAEVVPGARLERSFGPPDPSRQLAVMPLRLVSGPPREAEPPDWTPVRLTLAAAWGAALLCLAGVGALLAGSVTLAQRRADFVSAVTHELRTPLTTLRLYSDLLVEEAVPPAERGSYIATLKREADRLGHLVDNVLSFSRLERVRAPAAREHAMVREVLARVVPRLKDRAALGGLKLEVEVPEGVAGEQVRLDLASVEQILFNLVDNACKYGGNAERPALRLAAEVRGRHAVITLADQGKGIGERERHRLFRPFHRSAAQAAGSAPGVGLGLALSRRLARRMGGDLRLAKSEQGASFEIWLRRA